MTTEKLIRANEIQKEIDKNNKILKELEDFEEDFKKIPSNNQECELRLVQGMFCLMTINISPILLNYLINSISSYCNDNNAKLKSEFERL